MGKYTTNLGITDDKCGNQCSGQVVEDFLGSPDCGCASTLLLVEETPSEKPWTTSGGSGGWNRNRDSEEAKNLINLELQKKWSTWKLVDKSALVCGCTHLRDCALGVRPWISWIFLNHIFALFKIIMHQKGCVYSKVLVCPKSARSFKKCYGKQVEHLFLLEWRSRNILDWLNLVYI